MVSYKRKKKKVANSKKTARLYVSIAYKNKIDIILLI